MLLVIRSVVVNQLLLGAVFAPLSLQGSVSAVGSVAWWFFVAPPSDHCEERFVVFWGRV